MTRKEKREREDAIQERIELGYTPRQAEKAQQKVQDETTY